MRIRNLAAATIAAALGLFVTISAVAQEGDEPTRDEQISYMIGMDIGQDIKNRMTGVDLDTDMFLKAIRDVLDGNETMMTTAEKEALKQSFLQERQSAAQQAAQQAAQENATAGAAFLAENQQREEVTTTESGLQYEVIEQGDGPLPAETDQVKVHYRGTLLDGTEFDSSYSRGQPLTFALNGVIPGWTEGLQLMPVGSKYRLFIPSELAYGERGAGAAIGPNSTLIFEVELLEILEEAE